jgi:hypothetical protein
MTTSSSKPAKKSPTTTEEIRHEDNTQCDRMMLGITPDFNVMLTLSPDDKSFYFIEMDYEGACEVAEMLEDALEQYAELMARPQSTMH